MPKTPKQSKTKDHDIFMRGIFSYIEFVLKILDYAIPIDLKPYIDFSTLKIMPDTHVSIKLSVTQSDTIYEAEINVHALPKDLREDESRPNFRFCFLSEFKSSKPSLPIDFQIDGYVKSIIRNDLSNKKPPSIVLPILFYHGVTEWKDKRLHDLYSPYLPKTILDYIAFSKYLIIDLQAMSDELIQNEGNLGELRAAFLALKHAQEKDYFLENMPQMLKFVDDMPTTLLLEAYLEMLMSYFQRRSGLDDKTFTDFVEKSKTESIMVKEAGGFKLFVKNTREKAFQEGVASTESKLLEARAAELEAKKAKKEAELETKKAKKEAELETKKAKKEVELKIEKAVLFFMKTTQLTDAEIAEEMDLAIDFVQKIRKKS